MRSERTLIAGSALSILISSAALAQSAPPSASAPAADPAQAAPPPGYPPPPAGYPPPSYPQQQPGYPPPPAYGQPPGYAPAYPQTYASPPPPPPAPAGKHGFMPLLYMGANSFRGKAGEGFGAGFRLGAILGGRVTPQFSINGELTIDVMNPKNEPSGVDVTLVSADITLSPLFHLALSPSVELVIGPKLGRMGMSGSSTADGSDAGSLSASGWVFGANAGLFAAVSSSTSIGGLISFEGRSYSTFCTTDPGFAEDCSEGKPDNDKLLGISGALMF